MRRNGNKIVSKIWALTAVLFLLIFSLAIILKSAVLASVSTVILFFLFAVPFVGFVFPVVIEHGVRASIQLYGVDFGMNKLFKGTLATEKESEKDE